jgi:hypothetical protein
MRDTMVDLQLPLSAADTPRVRGAALVTQYRVDADAVGQLMRAIERTNYARAGAEGDDLADPLRAVLGGMQRHCDRVTQVRALLLPRSLFLTRSAESTAIG